MMSKLAAFAGTHMVLDPLISWGTDKIGQKFDYIRYDYFKFERPVEDDYDDYDDYK